MSFANALTEAMELKGMDITKLAQKADSSYEYIRQLGKGNAFPGRHLLKAICEALGADYEAMWKLVVSDKIAKKYGPDAVGAIGKNPRFLEIERLLPQLTPEQFDFILGAVEGIAKRNRNVPKKAQAVHPAKEKYASLKTKRTRPSSEAYMGVKPHEIANEVKR